TAAVLTCPRSGVTGPGRAAGVVTAARPGVGGWLRRRPRVARVVDRTVGPVLPQRVDVVGAGGEIRDDRELAGSGLGQRLDRAPAGASVGRLAERHHVGRALAVVLAPGQEGSLAGADQGVVIRRARGRGQALDRLPAVAAVVGAQQLLLGGLAAVAVAL